MPCCLAAAVFSHEATQETTTASLPRVRKTVLPRGVLPRPWRQAAPRAAVPHVLRVVVSNRNAAAVRRAATGGGDLVKDGETTTNETVFVSDVSYSPAVMDMLERISTAIEEEVCDVAEKIAAECSAAKPPVVMPCDIREAMDVVWSSRIPKRVRDAMR